MRHPVVRHLVSSLVLLAACATAPDEQWHTIFVSFDRVPTASDVAELEALGSTIQHRMELARAVTVRSQLSASTFNSVSGVIATLDLGDDEDRTVSVFMRTSGTPTEADAQDVEDAGAQRAHLIGPPHDGISAVILLSRLPNLDELDQFISIEVDFGITRIQPGR